jgi:hypothetical protein
MKLRESEAQNWRLLKDISEFITMDQKELIKYIEKDLMRNNSNGDILLTIVNALVRDLKSFFQGSVEAEKSQYPKLDLGNSFAETYIYEVQYALCQNTRLCTKADELSKLSLEEQIDYISKAIHAQDMLGQNRYRVSSLAVAALMKKIGLKEFCGCRDNQ